MPHQETTAAPHPYPGLRPFDVDESRIFFGRGSQVDEIIELLERHHFAAVMGGSGSGKSSLIRAGVIPKLRAYGISEEGDFWIPITFTPEDVPVTRLAEQLDKALESEPDGETARKRLRRIERILSSRDGLRSFLDKYGDQLSVVEGLESLRAHANLVIVVDQFEEIFRPSGSEQSRQPAALVDLLVRTFTTRSPRIYVIITLRTEDLHRCAAFLSLPEVLNETAFITRRLNEDELQSAIDNPPAIVARQLQRSRGNATRQNTELDAELRRWIYDDVARNCADTDHLPLLQHLLYQLWDQAQRREERPIPGRITTSDLEAIIGDRCRHLVAGVTENVKTRATQESGPPVSLLADCLERQAELIYSGLDKSRHEPDVARVMFQLLAFVDSSGNYTRRWTTRDEIRDLASRITPVGSLPVEQQQTLVDRVVSAYGTPHPFVRGGAGITDNIDVSHEAFIRKWPRFRDWLAEDRNALDAYTSLLERYRECKDECGGEPTLGRCIKRLSFGHLDRRLLRRVRQMMVPERGVHWVRIHERGGAYQIMRGAADQFQKVMAYMNWGEKLLRWRDIAYASFVVILISNLIGWGFTYLKGQTAEAQRRLFRAEAEVFQAYGVAAEIEPPGSVGPSNIRPWSHTIASLWEGAVALAALDETMGESVGQVGGRTLIESEMGPNRIRFGRALRLAQGASNGIVRSMLSTTAWGIGPGPLIGPRSSAAASASDNGMIGSSHWEIPDPADDPCISQRLREWLETRNGETPPPILRVDGSALPGMPHRRLYFNAEASPQIAIVSVRELGRDNSCDLVQRLGEAPGSALAFVDPNLTFYLIKLGYPNRRNEIADYRYSFRYLVWKPGCIDNLADCLPDWEVTASDRTSLLTRFKNQILFDPLKRRIELIPESEARGSLNVSSWGRVQQRDRSTVLRYVLSEPLQQIVQPSAGTPPLEHSNDDCQYRMERLDYGSLSQEGTNGDVPHACTSLGRLTAFASWVSSASQVDRALPNPDGAVESEKRLEGEQLIEIIDYDERLLRLTVEQVRGASDILKHPIARIPIKGERITGLQFPPRGEPGDLQVQFASGSRIDIVWGREALLKRACTILAQLDDEARKRAIGSRLHTPFFKQIVNAQNGIIARNNNYECVCGEADCSREE